MNDADYKNGWIREGFDFNGYEAFGSDMELCGVECSSIILSYGQVPGKCGGFGLPACDDDEYGQCVSRCMGNTTTIANKKVGPVYTKPCADCMGALSQCATDKCVQYCAQNRVNNGCVSK